MCVNNVFEMILKKRSNIKEAVMAHFKKRSHILLEKLRKTTKNFMQENWSMPQILNPEFLEFQPLACEILLGERYLKK
jgi:hypothetical protein